MKKILYLIFILLFLFSSLRSTEAIEFISVMVVYGIILLLFVITPFLIKKMKYNSVAFFLMSMYLFSCGISALLNSDLSLIIGACQMFILFIVSFIILPSMNIDINEVIFKTALISHIPLILYSLSQTELIPPYQGIFYNPNSMGNVAASLLAIVLACILQKIDDSISGETGRFHKRILFVCIALLCFFLYLVIASASRTSFLSCMVCLSIGAIFVVYTHIKHKKLDKFIIMGSFLSLISTLLVFIAVKYTSMYEFLYNNIIYKFEKRSAGGDMLTHRNVIWETTMKEAGFFGKGSSHFNEALGFSAHNTFISILGEYGWIPLLFFLLILLMCFKNVVKFTLKDTSSKYRYLPVMLLTCFITLSMGEVILYKLSMVAMFFSVGTTWRVKQVHAGSNQSIHYPKIQKKKRRRIVWR